MAPQDNFPFKCMKCPAKFQLMKQAAEHFVEYHENKTQEENMKNQNEDLINESKNEDQQFQCKTCYSTFTQRSSLKTHVKTVHEGKKRFQCNECESSFTSKQNLIKHASKGHIPKDNTPIQSNKIKNLLWKTL